MLNLKKVITGAAVMLSLSAATASAAIVSVTPTLSSAGTAAAIIAAPADVNDDAATNTGLQGFDEIANYTLLAPLAINGGSLAAGTVIDSHMIFLNSQGSTRISHDATWTFDGDILGIMSNGNGSLEVASSGDLGAAGTIYPLAPFNARGLENNDIATIMASNSLRTFFTVTEPGDWIRVITATAVPIPAPLALFLTGLVGLGFIGRRRRTTKS